MNEANRPSSPAPISPSAITARDVSVIVPSYNRRQQTLTAVKSVLEQTELPGEILVVDDCSADAVTEDDVRNLADAAGVCLRIIKHSANRGAAAARNTGVAEASRQYLAFLDSDDFWLPGKLAAQLVLVTPDRPLVAASCGWGEWRGGTLIPNVRIPRPSGDLNDFLSACWFCPGSTLLIARQALNAVGPFDDRLPRLEDYEWFVRFAHAGGTLSVAAIEGAQIAVGTRYSVGSVRDAAQRITRVHCDLGRPERRRMAAYLHQQIAAAELAEGRPVRFFIELARSLFSAPRASFHISSWWDYVERDDG